MNWTSFFTHHPFWGVLTLMVLLWYSTITVYVAVRGFADIKHLLRKLQSVQPADTAAPPANGPNAPTDSHSNP
jgi:hypothetical protein